jgi:hypothetical protein
MVVCTNHYLDDCVCIGNSGACKMNETQLAYENTMMRKALERIAEQLDVCSWDAATDGLSTPATIMSRMPHIAKFAADMAKDVNSRPGFKEYVYSRIADDAATA